jgi:Glycolipid 2-alpha-mannosyltransferase
MCHQPTSSPNTGPAPLRTLLVFQPLFFLSLFFVFHSDQEIRMLSRSFGLLRLWPAWLVLAVVFLNLSAPSRSLPTIQAGNNIQSVTARHAKPKAAFVVLAHDYELPEMVASMQQLEGTFNKRYHYHWVFFSNEEFSETFRRVTSNATNATCVYEQIPSQHWTLPQWVNHPQYDADLDLMCDAGTGKTCMHSDPHMYRWNSGLFAKEKRLRDYDWFWKVEPGVGTNISSTVGYLADGLIGAVHVRYRF